MQQTETLKLLFVLYFRVLKNPAPTPLLPAALQGISRFAHLVSIDFFKDLLAVLRELIVREGDEEEIGASERVRLRLACIVTAFELLSGQGPLSSISITTRRKLTTPSSRRGTHCRSLRLRRAAIRSDLAAIRRGSHRRRTTAGIEGNRAGAASGCSPVPRFASRLLAEIVSGCSTMACRGGGKASSQRGAALAAHNRSKGPGFCRAAHGS